MAFTAPTRDTVIAQALTFLRNRFPGRDDHTESFLGKLARAIAGMVWGFHQSMQQVDNDSIPSTKTSTTGLDNWAFATGLPADTAGTYGRKGASAASGGVGPCTGTNGTTFTIGATLLAPDGVTQLKLDATVTIPGIPPGTGTVSGSFSAVTKGTAGNLAIGTVLTWQSPSSGGDSTVILGTAITGAVDAETDPALLSRELSRLQIPPKGGTASDYRTWAESVAGVLRAYDYPLRGGTGTNHTLITGAGSGTARKPTSTIQTNVTNYITGTTSIEGQRPVTVDGYSTLLPYMTAGASSIRVRMVASLSKFAFDWTLGVTAFTVASYAAGPPGVITTNEALPTTLKTAVDAGSQPRLQIVTAGTVIPVAVRVTAYNSGAKTLTLENPVPAGFPAPGASNPIYPGGPMVATIASNLLAYVDGLGPSRAGGYAYALDNWEDTIAVSRLEQVALDSVDADGTKFASNAVTATIDGAATDKQANDTTANGPEMLYASAVAVTD